MTNNNVSDILNDKYIVVSNLKWLICMALDNNNNSENFKAEIKYE